MRECEMLAHAAHACGEEALARSAWQACNEPRDELENIQCVSMGSHALMEITRLFEEAWKLNTGHSFKERLCVVEQGHAQRLHEEKQVREKAFQARLLKAMTTEKPQ